MTANTPNTRISAAIERFPIAGRFIISRGAKTEAAVVTVHVSDGKNTGSGECVPYARYGETVEGVKSTIDELAGKISGLETLSRERLRDLLPAGAARNALDCAIWDYEAKTSKLPAFQRAGLSEMHPVATAYTISLDSPEAMAEAVRKAANRPILKIKLGSPEGDLERIRMVRREAPEAVLIADANEGWTERNLEAHLNACAEARFALIEQPLPAKADGFLGQIKHAVPICADESVHDRASLERLVGLYEAVNIKLDKTGGLTEALELAEAAKARGFAIMVGCMVGTSLAMAPALILAMQAQFVDLDGPLLLARDRENGLRYDGSLVYPPEPQLWG